MKQILLSIIFIFCVFQISAQVTLVLNPEMVLTDVDPVEFETVAHSYITNTGEDTITIRWIRQVEAISMGWQSAICDINACYSVETDSTPSDFLLTLAPGDSSMLDVHIRPGGLDGSANIKVRVEDVSDPENSVTGEYLFNMVSPTFNLKRESLKIYPNPAVDYFQLSDYDQVQQVAVSNLVGQELRRYNVYPGSKFNVSGLQRDIYLIRLLDSRNKVIKTFRLRKY
ncbi:MAG: T9SS type A sorting domain-containing protein [Saprospiraceae bacterium]|nr:T9SS type A sorting domain-containing protein [Saprospiraceae bacterium]